MIAGWFASRRARRALRTDQFGRFGRDSLVAAPANISCRHRIFIGDRVRIGPRAFLSVQEEHQGRRYEPRLFIGDRTELGADLVVACIDSVSIGPDVLAASRVFIGDTFHDYRDPGLPVLDQELSEGRPVSIERGAFLGIGSIILPGVTVGRGGYVGAGAVVTHDVPANSVVVGNPARVAKRWDGKGWVAPLDLG